MVSDVLKVIQNSHYFREVEVNCGHLTFVENMLTRTSVFVDILPTISEWGNHNHWTFVGNMSTRS